MTTATERQEARAAHTRRDRRMIANGARGLRARLLAQGGRPSRRNYQVRSFIAMAMGEAPFA